MTDRIKLHQPTKSECLSQHERCRLPVLIFAELKLILPRSRRGLGSQMPSID